jgi:Ser/Thr protein kinase RdoA (MazF antagonist)
MGETRKADVDLSAVRDIADRALPGTGDLEVRRTPTGTTTQIYRVSRAGVTLFVRIAEDVEDSMAMEAWVHRELRRQGVRIPEVVLLVPFDERINRSVMVTTEIPGRSIRDEGSDPGIHDVMVEAGRDLARIGEVTVRGFGWIRRDDAAMSLEADLPSARFLMLENLEEHLATLRDSLLDRRDIAAIERAIELHADMLDEDSSYLAHGDFDDTHIYRDGRSYSGIIDFGEIRGAPPLYDAAHYALHDHSFGRPTLPWLLEGYADEAPLPEDNETRIHLLTLLIGVRVLARVAGRPEPAYQRSLREGVLRALKSLPSG